MKARLFPPFRSQNTPTRGTALLLILGSLVLLAALMLAFLAAVRVDRRSSAVYAQTSSVRLLSDSVLNLVMNQVSTATRGRDAAGDPLAWASQPGMIRTFDISGNLRLAYKLYSWPNMAAGNFDAQADGESAPADWASKPALFTDLNAPLRRSANSVLSYPILNPGALGKVEGFAIAGAPGDDAGAPVMPVYWLYQLQDGTWVAPESGPAGGREARIAGASETNPIVARAAFWADDETAKLNINTASEGQFWGSPRWMTAREMHLGKVQPAKNEFQRYPGHPFSTSLSPVLGAYAGIDAPYDAAVSSGTYLGSLPEEKERFLKDIYSLVPKVEWGGSEAGTKPFDLATEFVPLARDERLYATVDELAFRPPSGMDKERNTISNAPISQRTLEELRFFLTANSRAPEVNLFNQPRVSIWPVDDPSRLNPVRQANNDPARNLADQQSPLDKLLAFCSTLRSDGDAKAYYFDRSDPTSPTADLSAGSRNMELYGYLRGLLERPVPGFGGAFSTKYPQDHLQILTQVFDYIRSTNLLYAGGPDANDSSNILKADFRYAFTTPPSYAGGAAGDQYSRHTLSSAAGPTGGGSSPTSLFMNYAASGQVVPIQGPGNTKGFGSFPTISQVGIMFITRQVSPRDAAGNPNYFWDASNSRWVRLTETNKAAFGVSTIGNGVPACPEMYYRKWTNSGDPNLDTSFADFGTGDPDSPFDTTLPDGHIRMQALFLIEPFWVSPGYPGANPDCHIVARGLNAFTVDGQPIGFPASGTLVLSRKVQSTGLRTNRHSTYAATSGVSSTLIGRNLGAAVSVDEYPFYSTSVVAPATSFAFGGGAVEIEIRTSTPYPNSNLGASAVIQTMNIDFPGISSLPAPVLPAPAATNLPDVGTDAERRIAHAFSIRHFGHEPFPGKPGRFREDQDSWVGGAPRVRWNGPWSDRFFLPRTLPASATAVMSTDPDDLADIVQSVEVSHGDVRLIAGRQVVPAGSFQPHRQFGQKRSAHNFRRGSFGSRYYLGEGGRFVGGSYFQEISFGNVNVSHQPMTSSRVDLSASGGDWDTGLSRSPDGPFINKAEEGIGFFDTTKIPYFSGLDEHAGFFTAIGANRVSPNRLLPSAVMFGSLPTGVNSGRPWETLLFAPNPSAGSSHFSLQSGPRDHLILDLFHMPVVEPYAISEPFSTAGKVNLNFRMVPFRHIRRDSGLRGVFRAARIAAVSASEAGVYKGGRNDGMAVGASSDYRYPIHDGETLKAFEARFDAASPNDQMFKSASEICDMFLYPADQANPTSALVPHSAGEAAIRSWWAGKALTGDNMREQPYSVIYPRVTTKSNTFTVHMKVQTLAKVRGGNPEIWDENRDKVTGEYQGSATFERFIDPNHPGLPDFAVNGGNLDEFYQFRVLYTKEFQP